MSYGFPFAAICALNDRCPECLNDRPDCTCKRTASKPTCPIVDDRGTVEHLYVIGKRTCLCGERPTPDFR